MALVNAWTASLIFVISLARMGMGIYTSISGPTLMYLADKVDADIYKISTMFTGRSIGILLGAILGRMIMNVDGPNVRHLLTLGSGMGILGLTAFMVPWIEDFGLLIVGVTIGGMMFGYLDAGMHALILLIWGERASRPYIHIFHLMYIVGAFIAPFIARPFLFEADNSGSTNFACPSSNMDVNATSANVYYNTTDVMPVIFNPTGWIYITVSVWMVFVSMLFISLSLFNVEARVSAFVADSRYTSEDREEEPINDLVWFFLAVTGYYFCTVSTENVYYNYIYLVSICSDLHFTITQASYVTSIFWLGFGLGRATGAVGANFVKPQTLIILSISGTIIDMTFVSIFGAHNAWLVWLVSASHGYSTAMLYPSGVSWISQITNMSGTYMFVVSIGNATGSLSMLLLAGYLFDHVNPFSVMYLVLGISIANAVFFALLSLAGRRHLNHQSTRHQTTEQCGMEESRSLLSNSDQSDHLLGPDSNLIKKSG